MNLHIDFYDFRESRAPIRHVQTALALSRTAAQAIHGEDRVRIETRCEIDRHDRSAKIDTGTVVGRHVSRMFAGFLRRLFTVTDFEVDRLEIDTDEDAGPLEDQGHCRDCARAHDEDVARPRARHESLNGRHAPRARHADETRR